MNAMANILLIEDDRDFAETLKLVLEDYQHQVHCAANARQALAVAQKHKLELIVSDIRIEGDVDGLTALEKIKALHPHMKTIVMTGFAIEDAPLRAVKIKVDDYLNKPFGEQVFMVAVERALTSSSRRLGFDRLLSTFRSLSSKIVEAWEGSKKSSAGGALLQARDEFYQAYYTLIRARKLACRAALNCWEQLETLERGYLRYQAQPDGFQPEQLRSGAQAYQALLAKVTKMAETNDQGSMRHTFSFPRFKAFFDLIVSGGIALEELHLAYALWLGELEQSSRHSRESRDLFTRMWGSPPTTPSKRG